MLSAFGQETPNAVSPDKANAGQAGTSVRRQQQDDAQHRKLENCADRGKLKHSGVSLSFGFSSEDFGAAADIR
jgi:hypothetical protein